MLGRAENRSYDEGDDRTNSCSAFGMLNLFRRIKNLREQELKMRIVEIPNFGPLSETSFPIQIRPELSDRVGTTTCCVLMRCETDLSGNSNCVGKLASTSPCSVQNPSRPL